MPDAAATRTKEAAEVELLHAQIAKLEREAHPPSWLSRITDLAKVLGALILGAGGVTAAITGYQASEVKKERLELAFEKKQAELRVLDEQFRQRQVDFDKLGAELAQLGQVVEGRQSDYGKEVQNVEQVQQQLVALRGDVAGGGGGTRLEAAIKDVNTAKASAEKRKADLGQVRTEIQRLTVMQKDASNKLAQSRKQATQKLSPMAY